MMDGKTPTLLTHPCLCNIGVTEKLLKNHIDFVQEKDEEPQTTQIILQK